MDVSISVPGRRKANLRKVVEYRIHFARLYAINSAKRALQFLI